MPASSSPAEGRVGEDDVHALLLPDLGQPEPECIPRVDARRPVSVQQQVHLGQQEGQRLRLHAQDAVLLEDLALLDRVGLLLEMPEGFDEEPARAARGIEDGLPEPRVDSLDHETHHGARGCRTRPESPAASRISRSRVS